MATAKPNGAIPWYLQRTFWVMLGQFIAGLGELLTGGIWSVIGGPHMAGAIGAHTIRQGTNKVALARTLLPFLLLALLVGCTLTQQRADELGQGIVGIADGVGYLTDKVVGQDAQIQELAGTVSTVASTAGTVAGTIGPILPPPFGPIVAVVGYVISALGGIGAHVAQRNGKK